MNSKFDLSIVIPVYNSTKYLRSCLESIFSSAVNKELLQIILVDDGSDEGIYDLCLSCLRENPDRNITVKQIRHSGASAARNCGIWAAEGKYIMFMDSDDVLHEDALNYIIRFFDMHEDETDVLLCHNIYMSDDGTAAADSKLYKKVMPNSGIYDLANTMLYTNYSLPIIKNRSHDTPLFNRELYWREDMEYLYRAASEKGTVGYIKEAKYYKLNRRDSCKTDLRTDKLLSEQIVLTAEKILSNCLSCERVSYAAYAGIINMFNSHVRDDSFWPHQYEQEKYKEFEDKIKDILMNIPVQSFVCHPELDKYGMAYWLQLRPNADIQITLANGSISLTADGSTIEKRKNVEWTLRRIRSSGNKVTVYGDFKLALFNFLDFEETVFMACINNSAFQKLNVKPSFSGYTANSRINMNKMWSFQLTVDAQKVSSLELFVKIRDIKYPCVIVNCASTVFNSTNSLSSGTVGNILVTQSEKRILKFKILTEDELIKKRQTVTDLLSFDIFACMIRKSCDEFIGRHIWMYNDNFAMVNNGFFQFSHDVRINDGIERYYVVKNPEAEEFINADEVIRSHLVRYGSKEHILYFLNAEKIFTAFTSGLEWRAIQYNEMYKYWDIFNAEVILLSHGVLNQYWPWSFSPIRMCIDKVVVSTFTEYRAWCENGFWQKDLIPSGMPRYSRMIDTIGVPPKRKILMALSWRMYLAGKHEILLDAATSRIALDDKYINSSYFRNFMEFVNSSELEKILVENDLELDINLHPQFNLIYRSHMNITNSRVNVTDGNADLSEYIMMISDISSIIFDFAIYKRPILYFVPDIMEFKAGRNHFREVIIPFEDGLGPYAYTATQAVEEVKKLAENGFQPEEKYRRRLEHHHIPLDDCCGRLYRYCTEENTEQNMNGSTPETVNQFMDKVLAAHNGKSVPLLKTIYDCLSIPYNKTLKCGLDRTETDLRQYFDKVKSSDRYVVCFAVSDTASRYWREFKERSGLPLKLRPGWRYSYLALMENGKTVYENCERGALFYNYTVKKTGAKLALFSRYFDEYEYPKTYAVIALNGSNYSVNRRGINVVVYDKQTDTVCDSFSIDLYADPQLKIVR